MAETTTTRDPFKAETVTDGEVDATIDVFMRDTTTSMRRFASGHTLNPAAAVKAREQARKAAGDQEASEAYRWGTVQPGIRGKPC